MTPAFIWLFAAAVYAALTAWYTNLRGPLSDEEIAESLDLLAARAEEFDSDRLAVLRRFLESDDGREFFMLNLVRFHPGEVRDPGTGSSKPAPKVLEGYTRPFLRALLKRAGHPVFGGREEGRYVEAWGVEADPGWTFGAVMRYRSRRDMLELVVDPMFSEVHVFKEAAMSNTLAFPIAPAFSIGGPRLAAALVLALVAAVAHLASVAA